MSNSKKSQTSTSKQINLKSSVTMLGKTTTQVFHFTTHKATYSGILTESIKEGEMLKMMCEDGRMLVINKVNLLFTEVFPEDE